MGWLIALGVIFLLGILPLGFSVKYDDAGPLVRLIAGPIRLILYPRPRKEKKSDPKADAKKAKKEAEKKAAREEKKKVRQEAKEQTASEKLTKPLIPPKKGGSLLDFLPLVQVLLDFLGGFRRKLRVNVLQLKLVMAADDPCDLAVNYGRAWAALGNLMPRLEKLFVIKKRDLQIECDFTASQTLITARLDLTITLGRLLGLVVVLAFRALRKYLIIQKKRKGGAKK